MFVTDMEGNEYTVQNASEALCFMSRLLTMLKPRDNIDFVGEIQREKKEENVDNLKQWLHEKAVLQSRGGKKTEDGSGSNKGQSSLLDII